MSPAPYNCEAPNRKAMLDAARAKGWPRIELSRDIVRGKKDWFGPGWHAWYTFADQAPDAEITDAMRALTDGRIIYDVRKHAKFAPPPDEQLDDEPHSSLE